MSNDRRVLDAARLESTHKDGDRTGKSRAGGAYDPAGNTAAAINFAATATAALQYIGTAAKEKCRPRNQDHTDNRHENCECVENVQLFTQYGTTKQRGPYRRGQENRRRVANRHYAEAIGRAREGGAAAERAQD